MFRRLFLSIVTIPGWTIGFTSYYAIEQERLLPRSSFKFPAWSCLIFAYKQLGPLPLLQKI